MKIEPPSFEIAEISNFYSTLTKRSQKQGFRHASKSHNLSMQLREAHSQVNLSQQARSTIDGVAGRIISENKEGLSKWNDLVS